MEANRNRREFKFVLKAGLAEELQSAVAGHLPPDEHSAGGYPVLSEYFDSADRASYWQKQFGVKNRRRLRVRVYGREDGTIPPSAFLEVKHKLNGTTVKRRVPVELEQLAGLSRGILPCPSAENGVTDARIITEVRGLMERGRVRPVVQIRYHRHAYDSGPEGSIRITFDSGLRCRFRLQPLVPDDPDFHLRLLESGASVMEVKTVGAVPYWFRRLVGEHSLLPRSFSKYSAALETYELKIPGRREKRLSA